MTENSPQNQGTDGPDVLDQHWHLAQHAEEVSATELEFALMRANEGFARWQAECLGNVMAMEVSGPENALLHIIRMHERPKSAKELARMTNRDDLPNIQYSLRKLVRAGLVLRKGSGRSGVTYEVTETGREVTENFAALRRRLLIAAIAEVPDFGDRLREATRTLNLLCGIYEEAARVAATHRKG